MRTPRITPARSGVRLRAVASTTFVTMALVMAGLALGAPRASAGDRVRVCDETLELNREPNQGRDGVLQKGESLRVRKVSDSGKYAYGFAYGDINRVGWVRSDGLCADERVRAAANGRIGDRVRVCVAKLELNREPNQGREGVLSGGETFRVRKRSDSGKYAYGFAYGHINRVGWVRSDGLCLDTKLSGPSNIRVLQQLTYRASGLPAGSYALLIERELDGATCTAHLAARRDAEGTELFHGSLPDGLQCVRGEARFSAATTTGTYRVHVRDDRGDLPPVASRTVRVVS